jgi:preprotein translocase subunit SecE
MLLMATQLRKGVDVMDSNTTKTQKTKKSWFKGLRAEFKKVVWPDRPSIAKRTLVVIIVASIVGVIITIVDGIIQRGLDFIIYLF